MLALIIILSHFFGTCYHTIGLTESYFGLNNWLNI